MFNVLDAMQGGGGAGGGSVGGGGGSSPMPGPSAPGMSSPQPGPEMGGQPFMGSPGSSSSPPNFDIQIRGIQNQLEQAAQKMGLAQSRSQFYPGQEAVIQQAQMEMQMLQMKLQELQQSKMQYEAEAQARIQQEEAARLAANRSGPMGATASPGAGGGGGPSHAQQWLSQMGAGQEKKFNASGGGFGGGI